MEHTDPFFVEVVILDLQKVDHGRIDIIVAIQMATTEYLLHLVEEVVVCQIR